MLRVGGIDQARSGGVWGCCCSYSLGVLRHVPTLQLINSGDCFGMPRAGPGDLAWISVFGA